MSWRVANSLLVLREQINAAHPSRNKADDGTIGDQRHQARVSDHNPDQFGIVRAMDITHDPNHGVDTYAMAETLRQNRDARIRYVISNRRWWSAVDVPYTWRGYHGESPHTEHVHISVVHDRRADDQGPWDLERHGPIVPPAPPDPVSHRFAACLPLLLAHEGGNDDDPRDPGGRTSRGITQSEWTVWRKHNPGLPADVWQAPQSQVEAIYHQEYWDVVQADKLPVGLDYCVFDYGVNSGVHWAAKQLQQLLGVNADGWIGPLTEAAAAKADVPSLINRYCDARMAYLRGRAGWPTYHNGWTRRVADVRRDALAAAQKE